MADPGPPTEHRLTAYHLADKLRVKAIADLFEQALVRADATEAVVSLGSTAWFAVYSFGAIVFFAAPEEQQSQVLERLQPLLTTPKERLRDDFYPTKERLRDDFLIKVDPTARDNVYFSQAVLCDLAPAKIEIIALVLAQSVTLEAYEQMVETLLDGAESITSSMKTGRLPGYTKATMAYIGLSLSTRRDLISGLYIVDAPEAVWEDPQTDRLYNQCKRLLEIAPRYHALEYKLKLIQESVEIIVDLTNTRRNLWLEVAIVVLIVVEIGLALWQHHPP
jgi:uncharacterized Rmd1/YagE family protein